MCVCVYIYVYVYTCTAAVYVYAARAVSEAEVGLHSAWLRAVLAQQRRACSHGPSGTGSSLSGSRAVAGLHGEAVMHNGRQCRRTRRLTTAWWSQGSIPCAHMRITGHVFGHGGRGLAGAHMHDHARRPLLNDTSA